MGRLAKSFEAFIKEAQQNDHIRKGHSSIQLANFALSGWEEALMRMKAERNVAPLEQFVKILFDNVLI